MKLYEKVGVCCGFVGMTATAIITAPIIVPAAVVCLTAACIGAAAIKTAEFAREKLKDVPGIIRIPLKGVINFTALVIGVPAVGTVLLTSALMVPVGIAIVIGGVITAVPPAFFTALVTGRLSEIFGRK